MEARSLRTPVSGVGDEDGDWDVGEGEMEGEEEEEEEEDDEEEEELVVDDDGEDGEVEDDGGSTCHREAFSTAHFRSSLTNPPPCHSTIHLLLIPRIIIITFIFRTTPGFSDGRSLGPPHFCTNDKFAFVGIHIEVETRG